MDLGEADGGQGDFVDQCVGKGGPPGLILSIVISLKKLSRENLLEYPRDLLKSLLLQGCPPNYTKRPGGVPCICRMEKSE